MQVMETRKRVLGLEHPDTLTSMNNLSFTWKDIGKQPEALKLMHECGQLEQAGFGSQSSSFSFHLCDVEQVAIRQ